MLSDDPDGLRAHVEFEMKLEAVRQEAAKAILRAIEAEILGEPCKDAGEEPAK